MFKKLFVLFTLFAFCSCSIEVNFYTSDGQPAKAKITTPDNRTQTIGLPGTVSFSRSIDNKDIVVKILEDDNTNPSVQYIKSVESYCEFNWFIYSLPLIGNIYSLFYWRCQSNADKDHKAYGYSNKSNIKINVSRKSGVI